MESKELSSESIKPPATSNNSPVPSSKYSGVRPRTKFDGQCLKQEKVRFMSCGHIDGLLIFCYEFFFVWSC